MNTVLTAGEGRDLISEFEQPFLVLVEGSDDRSIVAGLIRSEDIDGFHVHNMIGKDDWARKLRVIVRTRGFGKVLSLGLVRDADADGSAQFQSCQSSLSVVKLPVPNAAGVLEQGRPAVAVYIAPDIAQAGAIEELCLPSFDSARMACVDGYFDCLPNVEAPTSKARTQAYFAGLHPACRDFNVAIREGLIDFNNTAFDGLRNFLHEVRSV